MRSKILAGLCILAGLMMVNSGLNKFFHYMPIPKMSTELMSAFGSLMSVKWLLPLVGLAEINGGFLLIIPRLRPLGAIILLPVLVGIVIHHLVYDVAGGMVGYILFAIVIWAIIENRAKCQSLTK